MADRSTAAVGVANEGGEATSSARQGGATPDGTTTDDQTSGTADDTTILGTSSPARSATTEAAAKAAGRADGDPADPDPMPDPAPEADPDLEATAVLPADRTVEQPAPDKRRTAARSSARPGPAKPGTAKATAAKNGAPADATPAKATSAKAEPTAAKRPPVKATSAKSATARTGTTKSTSAKSATTETGTAKSSIATSTPDTTDATASATDVAATGTAETVTDAAAAAKNGSAEAVHRPARAVAPELHSGHKLARRYQLAECVTRVDGFSSWRAVDEKLRRAVGIHVLAADHPRGRQVLAAARSAALLGDPRFVQVLDAVEENDLAYVIHEWLPDAISLADLLAAGPLEPHEAYQMVSQVSQGMAAAHREGLAHLRLDPGAVLRTVSGQYRIRGLAVAAALRGLSSERPQRQDTEAIGALLYASLTQRWPYEEDAHGLTGLPKGVGLIAPDQVRAGVHRGLSDIAIRALVNDGATASREEPPCTTPEELAKTVAGLPRIRPPEHSQPVYQPSAFQQPPKPPGGATRQPVGPPPVPPPALPGRTGQALKWAVASLVIVAIGLGSWQLADAMKSREDRSTGPTPTSQKGGQDPASHPATRPIKIVGGAEFAPDGHPQAAPAAGNTYDGDTSTYWETKNYVDGPTLAPYKQGVGVIYDLGSSRSVSSASLTLRFAGDHTSASMYSVPSLAPSGDVSQFTRIATAQTRDSKLTLKAGKAAKSRYVLIWITAVPYVSADSSSYDKPGFKQAVEEVSFSG